MHQYPQVLIFPFPAQGHVNSMLKLAELLALASLTVTFLSSKYNHECLVCHIDILSHFTQYPGFKFETIPDGLPQDHPLLGIDNPPPDCIIGDGALGFTFDVANELGIPIIQFCTISAGCIWVYFSISDMIQAGELPIKVLVALQFCQGQLMEFWFGLVNSGKRFLWVLRPEIVLENDRDDDVPAELEVLAHWAISVFLTHSGCNSTLESMSTGYDINEPIIQLIIKQTQKITQANALKFNTTEELDGPILSQIRTKCPKDRSCIAWLDKQPNRSVIYASLGSITSTSMDQLVELWYGLLDSKMNFLFIVRQDSVIGKDGEGEDVVKELSKKRLDMKDVCDRKIVEKMVNDVMVDRKEGFAISASEMAKVTNRSVSADGSSYSNFDRLIEDIRIMSLKTP
ncbi:hypothetical protein ES288_A10G279200v1 [Gossypium darwinii]|uniref:UDP-glycosyltransferases domain-containing protein n=2 Tax=Gossypium TaxID=3633 RepID=A0A5D2F4A7_GOSDA|nr:hypothetical protein ES288_A10G279200v1 [Gossypium darwinii]